MPSPPASSRPVVISVVGVVGVGVGAGVGVVVAAAVVVVVAVVVAAVAVAVAAVAGSPQHCRSSCPQLNFCPALVYDAGVPLPSRAWLSGPPSHPRGIACVTWTLGMSECCCPFK